MDAKPSEERPAQGDAMIRRTVHSLAKKIEHLSQYQIPIQRSLDLLEQRARTIEEIVVIEVMRESYLEMASEVAHRSLHEAQADSSSRTARMPSMAFSR
jgi:hypothetical protein